MKKIFSFLVILLLSVSLIGGCTNKDNPEVDKDDTINKEENNVEKTAEAQENNGEEPGEDEIKEGIFPGDKAYDFVLLDREGNEISLSSLKGKVIFLNFWASWCGPCRAEMPDMQKVHEEYKEKDVIILAVNITASEKKGIEGVNSFLDKNKLTFPVLYDKDGDVSVKYRVSSIPTTYIINKEGIIVSFVTGALSEDRIKELIEAAME